MDDVIKLLPDSVANQIAAGEVIQRPASAVKELMENAIDAGASYIKLIVKDAGKTLIQLVDDGKGMTETDARICFERHATSKISSASDLFSIRTMGFRGEALASIAAISRVEMKTKTADDQVGTEVIVEGSVHVSQLPCQCSTGTNISIKNLFFNTPARRNFLKSEQVEKGHIFNEFVRVSLSNSTVAFELFQNNLLTHKFEKSNLKQRIVSIFGNQYQQRLVPVDEKTEIVSVHGFVLKPEFAKKRKNEQFFFVNNRYIRSPYLSHAVEQAYLDLIPEDMYPSFFLFLETDPTQIDVNVHPTKTEIKFQDERYVYQIIKSSVKRSLGKFNITPTLDFERETAFDDLVIEKNKPVAPPSIHVNPEYNPFKPDSASSLQHQGLTGRIKPEHWESMFPGKEDLPLHRLKSEAAQQSMDSHDWERQDAVAIPKKIIHLHNRYIMVPVKSGLMVIDHEKAHERILFERFIHMLEHKNAVPQQLLFPENIILLDSDVEVLREIMPQFKILGFDIVEMSKGTFVVNAVPGDFVEKESIQNLVEGIIEQYKQYETDPKADSLTSIARSLAKRLSLKHGKPLCEEEMVALIDALFACQLPYQSPSGKATVSILSLQELAEKFK
jgi:DNA mismatch repair protein MutL